MKPNASSIAQYVNGPWYVELDQPSLIMDIMDVALGYSGC